MFGLLPPPLSFLRENKAKTVAKSDEFLPSTPLFRAKNCGQTKFGQHQFGQTKLPKFGEIVFPRGGGLSGFQRIFRFQVLVESAKQISDIERKNERKREKDNRDGKENERTKRE